MRNQVSCHDLREICQFLLVAMLAILLASPRAAYAATISSPSSAELAVTMQIRTTQFLSRVTKASKLVPLIPVGGLPMFPAVFLWLPETENLSSAQVVHVQSEPSHPQSRSYRWVRIGMLILLGLGLLGMLFG